jgi:glucokinase
MQNYFSLDIGGTKVLVGHFQASDQKTLHLVNHWSFPSRRYQDFNALAKDAVSLIKDIKIDGVGIGLAGPVRGQGRDQVGRVTNLNWEFTSSACRSLFACDRIYLCNDMQSHGWGSIAASESAKMTLQSGIMRLGPRVIIAAGTGLGESVIGWDGHSYNPMDGEGGHGAFSPCDALEDELLLFLRQRYLGHVSWERVLGGFEGFRNLYSFMLKYTKAPANSIDPNWPEDLGATLHGLAQSGHSLAISTLQLYAKLLGREAANLALKCPPYSGVYLCGGIAPKIYHYLQSHFIDGFLDKGRFQKLLSEIPVIVINEPLNGLRGAATAAVMRGV